eukprot:2731228-Amphidinium_carterae.1
MVNQGSQAGICSLHIEAAEAQCFQWPMKRVFSASLLALLVRAQPTLQSSSNESHKRFFKIDSERVARVPVLVDASPS